MKKKKIYSQILLSFVLISLLNFFFFLVLQPIIITYLNNHESYPLLDKFVNFLYPRFIVENQRFSSDFFIGKFKQIIYRVDVIYFLFLLVIIFFASKNNKTQIFHKAAELNPDPNYISNLSNVFYIGCLIYTYDWYFILLKLHSFSALYKPASFFILFLNKFPSKFLIHCVCIAYYIAIFFVIVSKNKFWFSLVISLLFFLQLGLQQGFEKIDHTYASFGYAILLLPFILFYNRKQQIYAGSGIFFIQVVIGFSYLFSGLEKLMVSGIHWINGHTFQSYMELHQSESLISIDNQMLLILLANSALIFQLSFIICIFYKRWRPIYILLGIVFHWGTVILLNVGSYYSPWIFMYIFLIDKKTFTFNSKIFL